MRTPGKWLASSIGVCKHGGGGSLCRRVRLFGPGFAKDTVGDAASDIQHLIVACNTHDDLVAACKQVEKWRDLVRQNYPEMLGPFEAVRDAMDKVAAFEITTEPRKADANGRSKNDGTR